MVLFDQREKLLPFLFFYCVWNTYVVQKISLFLSMKQVKYLLLGNCLNKTKSWNATNN